MKLIGEEYEIKDKYDVGEDYHTFKFGVAGSYRKVHYSSAGGNCKLCRLNGLGYVFDDLIEKDEIVIINRIKEILSVTDKLTFEINVNDKYVIEILNKYFKMLFCKPVPIGYDGGYTYFALFMGNFGFISSDITHDIVCERLESEQDKISELEIKCKFKQIN